METKNELIFQALGAASMCWSGTPSGIFDSTRCKQIGDELIAALENAEALKPSHNSQSVAALQELLCHHKGGELTHARIVCIVADFEQRLNAGVPALHT